MPSAIFSEIDPQAARLTAQASPQRARKKVRVRVYAEQESTARLELGK